uniref:LOB domain-containing protein n=1 Tax=Oryza rufipogon TaxID=4529 RepID=A0A0E0R351_ORYRU
MATAAAAGDGDEHLLSLFASALSHRRFGDQELSLLDAALSAGADVPSLLHTRSSTRCLLRKAAAQAFSSVPDLGTTLSVADFFARAFALTGNVESCLAMRYEALLLRQAKYSDDLHLQVSNEEWLTFAKDSLDNGFYTIASKAQSAEYMKRKASGVDEKCNLHLGKTKLPGSLMFRLGIKTRNIQKLRCSREKEACTATASNGGKRERERDTVRVVQAAAAAVHVGLLRRRCTSECVFAPYFPAEEAQRFAMVHRVFGASNVSKMLLDVPPPQRPDAVSSLVYEANARMRDPVYGCVAAISFLQNQVSQLQMQLALAHAETAALQLQLQQQHQDQDDHHHQQCILENAAAHHQLMLQEAFLKKESMWT